MDVSDPAIIIDATPESKQNRNDSARLICPLMQMIKITRSTMGPIMLMNKLILSAVGADLSRPPPIMAFNKITWTSVGADLSRPPPIYRPSVAVPISRIIC